MNLSSQPCLRHELQRISLLLFITLFAATLLEACIQKDKMIVRDQREPTVTSEVANVQVSAFFVEELDVRIEYPGECKIEKSNEENRRGSFVSYDFHGKDIYPCNIGPISPEEMQFHTIASIESFERKCEDFDPCFFGDWPDSKDYTKQKVALSMPSGVDDFAFRIFNGQPYLVRTVNVPEGAAMMREYVTFFDDLRVEVRISWDALSLTEQEFNEKTRDKDADKLFEEKIRIVKLQSS